MATKTLSEMKTQIVTKAGADEDFRARLIADPKSVIEAELNVSIPDQFAIHVHEDGATGAHLTLPPSERLTESDLAQVAGGGWRDELEDAYNSQ